MNRCPLAAKALTLAAVCLMALGGCGTKEITMDEKQLEDFAARYAAAWSGGDPVHFATFYAENATFRINDGKIAVGREAIASVAGSFMTEFPDMVVALEKLVPTEGGAEFHWRWTGTNTGPDGTGLPVDMTGFEEWTMGEDGLIQATQGHFDDAEFARQMGADSGE